MRKLGWVAEGLEPDPEAAERARAAGLPVTTASIEDEPFPRGAFDALTMSQVIEHVHDPGAALGACRRLLRPGGLLWLATPNLGGYGHAFYGRDWLGLDPPRHLVLFTRESLVRSVEQAGFTISALPRDFSAERNFPCSAAIAAGVDSQDPIEVAKHRSRARVLVGDVLGLLSADRTEETLLLAKRI